MPTNKLTEAELRRIVPSDKIVRRPDGGGLYVEVHPNGGCYWRMKYRFGTEKRLAFGVYPDVSLAEARRRRDDARALVRQGVDPGAVKRAAKAERARKQEAERLADAGQPVPGTFEYVARDWLVRIHEAKVSADHAARTKTRLEQDAFPTLGRRAIDQIDTPELLRCLRRVEARGAHETAHRVMYACGQVFRYGIAIGACKHDPTAGLADALHPVRTKHHAAIIDPIGLGKLLRDVAAYEGQPVTRAALQLSALLLLRPGELRHMQWAWLDLDGAMLVVPPGDVPARGVSPQPGQAGMRGVTQRATADSRVGTVSLRVCRPSNCM